MRTISAPPVVILGLQRRGGGHHRNRQKTDTHVPSEGQHLNLLFRGRGRNGHTPGCCYSEVKCWENNLWNDRDCGARQYIENTHTVIMGAKIVQASGAVNADGGQFWYRAKRQAKDALNMMGEVVYELTVDS